MQLRRKGATEEDRRSWEKEVMRELVDVCELCVTERTPNTCKFYYVTEELRNNNVQGFE